jgi:glycosyltransferase involved in cell wall biosynthesis
MGWVVRGILLLAAAVLAGFGLGMGIPFTWKHSEEAAVIDEMKSFAVVLIGRNDAPWIERSLRSIFEQDCESLRLVFIDDGSRDETYEKVRDFIVKNGQEGRAILMKNEIPLGFETSLCRAAEQCQDEELVVPLRGKDWLLNPSVLSRLNAAFQSKETRAVVGAAILYPTYRREAEGLYCAYKKDLMPKKAKKIDDPLIFSNVSAP